MRLFYHTTIALMLFCLVVATADANKTQQPSTTEQQKKAKTPAQKVLTNKADKKTKKSAVKVNKKTGRFTPSEKISQDLSVSFPVDI